MSDYHLRRTEKELKDPAELRAVLLRQRYLTIAMCRAGQPYLVTLSYAYDEARNCLYFHCASEGKKIDFLRENPYVWGQVVEDLGYLQSECDHAFRSVHFRGRVEMLKTPDEKKHALSLMIGRLEDRPDEVRRRLIADGKLEKVTVGRIALEAMTGKANLPAKGV